jgi:hypothetical protein
MILETIMLYFKILIKMVKFEVKICSLISNKTFKFLVTNFLTCQRLELRKLVHMNIWLYFLMQVVSTTSLIAILFSSAYSC